MKLRGKVLSLLGGRTWIYVLSLLVPLLAYTLALKVSNILAQGQGSGLLGSLRLMRSDLLFGTGYALVWIGLFAVADRGIARRVVVVLFHAAAILVAVISTCAYQYITATGTPLGFGMVAYYVGKFGEAKGAIASEAPGWLVILLLAALIYGVLGPLWITVLLAPRRRPAAPETGSRPAPGTGEAPARPPSVLSRRRFLAGGVGAAAGLVLVRGSLASGASAGVRGIDPRAPVSDLIATEIEGSQLAAASRATGPVETLANIRLAATGRTRRRHVALIHLESTRERSSTPYNKEIPTQPYLDELARESLLVERAYTTIPHTSKAMVSVDAGLYPHPSTDVVEARPGGMPARCLAELLGEQGYRTAWFQSATQTFEDRAQLVKNFGYGHFQAYESMKTEGFQTANYLGYEDDIMLGPGRDWLEGNANDPTLVMYMGVTPHHQYLAPTRYGRKKFASKPGLDRYLNAIRYDDYWVRNIIQMYKDLGLYEDTIFVIYGDHGEGFGEHGRYQHDGVIWEEGLRVPLIVHDPKSFDGGARVEGPAHLMDFAPTIVDMLGYEVKGGEYPGRSILGDLPEDRTLFFGCRPDLLSMASITGNEKYIYHFGNLPDEFYDLSRDPLEQRNLAARAGKGKLDQKRSDLLEWHARASAAYDKPGTDPS
ncbi:MAG TPA: sulfatase-like hydrolase/transferase [Rubrobacter sp.]|nr:sulfatase-like hydrolase/transferase [Rubrobacter sp.]